MLILLPILLLISPVNLTLTWDQGLTIVFRIWGIGRSFPVAVTPSGQSLPHRQFMRLVGTLLRTDKARRFLFRPIHLVRLQALLRIGLHDAAHTALLSGLLQQFARMLPAHTDIRIQPDFLTPTHLQARCILFFHLGTLLIIAAMVLAAYLLESREHPAPQAKEA